MITPQQLTQVCPSIKNGRAISIANALDEICQLPIYGINTPDIFHEFIANILEECGEFTVFEESLNYKAERLMAVWPSRFKTLEDAQQYAHQPQKLAEKVYGNRKDLGNIHPGDGWKFRGSGVIQLTGRSNFTNFTIFYNKTFNTSFAIELIADQLRLNLNMGIHSACWVFAIAKNLIPLAIQDNIKEIVKRINGGTNGMSKRLMYYDRAKKYII